MHLVVGLLLGICAPLGPMGVAAVAVSAETVDAAGELPSQPAKVTGALTEGEKLFQGVWRLHAYQSDRDTGELQIDARAFRADGINGRYEGYVTIRPDASPAQIDFTIETCDCKFEGMTSTGIYYEDDGTIVFAGPSPGDARPEAFDGLDYLLRMRRADPAADGDGTTPR